MKKKFGFTLAEVLITLGIIGIVAALTIPTLISKYQDKVTVTRLKQAYSMLSQAYLRGYEANDNLASFIEGDGLGDASSHESMANYFKPYLKISEDCIGKNESYVKEHCINVDSSSPSVTHLSKVNYAYVKLNNGASIGFRVFSPNCKHYLGENYDNVCGHITVRTMPMDSQQQVGKNFFSFYATTNGIVPPGGQDSKTYTFERGCNPNIEDPYPGMFSSMSLCTAWVIQNGNLDYWKCPGQLSWDGAHSCNE